MATSSPSASTSTAPPTPSTTAAPSHTSAQPATTPRATLPRVRRGLRRAANRTFGAISGAITATMAIQAATCGQEKGAAPWPACPVGAAGIPVTNTAPSTPAPTAAIAHSHHCGCRSHGRGTPSAAAVGAVTRTPA